MLKLKRGISYVFNVFNSNEMSSLLRLLNYNNVITTSLRANITEGKIIKSVWIDYGVAYYHDMRAETEFDYDDYVHLPIPDEASKFLNNFK